jgi:hypothetical protein
VNGVDQKIHNNALHLTAFPPRSKTAGELVSAIKTGVLAGTVVAGDQRAAQAYSLIALAKNSGQSRKPVMSKSATRWGGMARKIQIKPKRRGQAVRG